MQKAISDRIKFILTSRLCFGCLKSGHHSKSCISRCICDHKRHPTCLHAERTDEAQRPLQVSKIQDKGQKKDLNQNKEKKRQLLLQKVIRDEANTQTAAIIPVWHSSPSQPAQEVLVYALLYSQSDTTFILTEVAEDLEANKEKDKLRLSTITSRTLSLPPVYT